MRHLYLFLFSFIGLCFTNLYSQEAEQIKQFLQSNTSSAGEYYKKYHSRKPFLFDKELLSDKNASFPKTEKSQKALNMPEKFWFPGEFEEVQAILITWSYLHLNLSSTSYVTPVNDSLGLEMDAQGNIKVSKYRSYIDTFSDTRLPIIFAQLADAIQQGGAEVWINICNAKDSLTIKHYMQKKGMPLSKYRFFVNPGNSFWYRDCGPVAFYEGDNDNVAFLDFEYYPGRPADDIIPIRVGNQMGFPVYTTSIELEGGNILLDGAGTLFTSDQIYSANQDIYGQYYIEDNEFKWVRKTGLTRAQIQDSLIHLMGLDRLKALPSLVNDGGTGHIDLYAAMWDENNFVFTKYPQAMSKQRDYSISSKNIDTILSMHTVHGEKYRATDIPLPLKDDVTWYKNAADFEKYTRTYSNSTFVNNVIIQPIFSDDNWGAREWDLKALEIMEKRFPGYKIIPIDIRGYEDDEYSGFDGTGGAIHCITKQIPAENPIRILHQAVQGYANRYNGSFPIDATVTNKSGIASVKCYWRTKGNSTWNELALNAGQNNAFSAILERNANVNADTIEYYLSAKSNNGKTITKPFTAPEGYYTFYYGSKVSEEKEEDVYDSMPQVVSIKEHAASSDENKFKIGNFYPNPADLQTNISISMLEKQEINIRIINMLGQLIYENKISTQEDDAIFTINTSSFPSGMYSVIFSNNFGESIIRKISVQKK